MENHIRAAQSVATQTTGLDGSIGEPNQLLDAALKYAARGWAVIPLHTPNNGACSCNNADCSSPGKHPRTRKGLDDATTDPKRIRQFWKIWPTANIGIVTGTESGLLVLDIDDKGRQKGSDSLAALMAENPQPLNTLTVRTGSGKHLYFKHPGYAIKNSVGAIGAGLDVRSERGYVVASPSLHANGSKYQIDIKEPLAEVPDWLLHKMTEPKPTTEEHNDNEHNPFSDAPNVSEGQRNETLFKLASALRGQHGMEQEQIRNILLEYNNAKCDPPLPNDEILRICASACRFPAQVKATKSAKRQEENPLYWFKFNVRNWFSDQNIILMSDYQTGWYIRLLVFAWHSGGFLPADYSKLSKLAKAKSQKAFEKDCSLVLAEFEQVEIDGEPMLKHTKMAAQYAEELQKWTQKVEAAAKSKAARLALASAARVPAVPVQVQ